MKTLLFFFACVALSMAFENNAAEAVPPADSLKVCTLNVGEPILPDTMVWGD